MKKILIPLLIAIIITGCMPLDGTPLQWGATAYAAPLSTVNGTVIVEAEDLAFNTVKFKKVTGAASFMSGGAALSAMTDDKDEGKNDTDAGFEAHIDLSFTADETGMYAVWVRNTARQEGIGNSVFMSFSGSNYVYAGLNGDPDRFDWVMLGKIKVKAGQTGSVRLRRRQIQSIQLDKFIITCNPLLIPSGMMNELPGEDYQYTLPPDKYPLPAVTPPPEHPRLLFRTSDIDSIKSNMSAPQNSSAYQSWNNARNRTGVTGKLPDNPGSTSNYNTDIFSVIQAKAFDYAIYGNTANGREAINILKNVIKTADYTGDKFEVRAYGHLVYAGAEVYDWCYGLLAEDEKKYIVSSLESFATNMSIGYPPSQMGVVTGHASESQLLRDLLGLGIATYGDRSDIYNYVAGRFFYEYVQPRNFWYASGSYHQGSGYVAARFYWDLIAATMFKKISGVDVFSPDMQRVVYDPIYRQRPDGQHLRVGDDYFAAGGYTVWSGYGGIYFYAYNYFNDGYIKDRYLTAYPNSNGYNTANQGSYTAVHHLILNKPSLASTSVSTLPKTVYFGSPEGTMIARTGWNVTATNRDGNTDVLAYMRIGEMWPGNHAHLDAGHFQLYYKGILANDSGTYGEYGVPHDGAYYKTSIAHNTITVYNPNEQIPTVYGYALNTGGQRWPKSGGEARDYSVWTGGDYDTGRVLAHEFGPDQVNPAYSYIKGDITKAYYSDTVDEMQRAMLFMPLEDSLHPAAMVVFDKVVSKSASYQKSWLLHMQEAPQVSGNTITVTRTANGYGGRMTAETLLPKNASYSLIGGTGKQYMAAGTNFPPAGTIGTSSSIEAGWGRVEVLAPTGNTTDYFLHVLAVSDKNTNPTSDIKSKLLEGEAWCGAEFYNRVAIFARNEGLQSDIAFSVTNAGSKVFVSGVKAGRWLYRDAAGSVQQITASGEGKSLYFTAAAGAGTLSYLGPDHTAMPVDIDNLRISGTVGAGNTVTIRADLYGASSAAQVIFAFYQGNRLVGISTQPYTGSKSYDTAYTLPVGYAGTRVRAFVWNMQDGAPLATAKEIGIN